MNLKSTFDTAFSHADAATWLLVLNRAICVTRTIPEIERRINRVFESYTDNLAVKLRDPSVPWRHYDIGPLYRFLALQRGFGVRLTLRMLRQNVVADHCKNYDGADRRVERGSYTDRRPNASNLSAKRRTDSPEYYALLCKRISQAACN